MGKGSPLYFVIVGDGQQRRELEELTGRLGIAKNVVFMGHQGNVLPLMSAMDIYAQPSRNDGMGKTLVMAQSLGLPIVASRVCGIPGTVEDGGSAILVPPENQHALAEAILKVAGDVNLRASMAQAGKRWVKRCDDGGHPAFSVEAMVARLERLYLEPEAA